MFYYNPDCFGGLSGQEFVDRLIEEGVLAFIAYPAISDTLFFKENNFAGHINEYPHKNEADLTNARKIAANVVWLPHFTLLGGEQDICEIAGDVKKIQNAIC